MNCNDDMIRKKVRGIEVIFPDERIMQRVLKKANVRDEEVEDWPDKAQG